MPNTPELISSKEAAALLKVSHSTFKRLLQKHASFPGSYRVGRQWRFDPEALLLAAREGRLSATLPELS